MEVIVFWIKITEIGYQYPSWKQGSIGWDSDLAFSFRQTSAKSFFKAVMTKFTDAYIHRSASVC